MNNLLLRRWYPIFISIILIGTCFVPGITSLENKINNDLKQNNPEKNPMNFIEWEKAFDSGYYDYSRCVQQTKDGGYITVGKRFTRNPVETFWDIWLIKTDSMGNKEWDRIFDRNFTDENAYYVIQTEDGGYLVLGSTEPRNSGLWVIWLIKTDENGIIEWNYTYTKYRDSKGFCVQQTRDGGYVIAGITRHSKFDGDFWVLKLNSSGIKEWDTTKHSYYYDEVFNIKQTPDDGYICVGFHIMEGSDECSNIQLIKLYKDGNFQYRKFYGTGGTWNAGRSIRLTDDGDYIILGDYLLVKTDSYGNERWRKKIGGKCLQITEDGGFIIVGITERWRPNYIHRNLKLIKTDSKGRIRWFRILDRNYDDGGFFIQLTKDGGYIIAGFTQQVEYNADIWLIKTKDRPYLNTKEKTNQFLGAKAFNAPLNQFFKKILFSIN